MGFLTRVFLPALLVLGADNVSFAETIAPLMVKPGEYTEFDAPLTRQLREFASNKKRLCASTDALAAVAVPPNFDPNRPWPVLLVSATTDPRYNSSRRLMRGFIESALAAGWIVIAADPNSDRDPDTDPLRYALLLAAIGRLQLEWSHLPEWPRAFGGFSGGAKRSAVLAAIATVLGRRPIGVFQGGCNEPTMTQALHAFHPNEAQFLGVPVFLSGGNDDRIATREQVEDVAATLRSYGFKHIRYERFYGGHELHPAHVEAALRWFVDLAH
jgi:surfactin synthase thioesterase subunit